MGLTGFERRLEALVEGVFSRAFRSGLQPVEIGRRLARELDDRRTVGIHGLIAPNHFVVRLSEADRERFSSFEEALAQELADAARAHAKAEGYGFLGQVTVELETGAELKAGQCLVGSEIMADPGGRVGTLVTSEGRRVPVAEQPVVIGRLSSCDIPLGDPQVSRRHAEVRRDAEGFCVFDLGSTNGTAVNGTPVRERRLSDGDELRIGSATIRFESS
ncbi:MAG: FhaA domain-containing protein [Acidimicrobiia bacterium]